MFPKNQRSENNPIYLLFFSVAPCLRGEAFDLRACFIISDYSRRIVEPSLHTRRTPGAAIHSYGGIVLNDIITNTFARKAIEKGADGLVAVAAGAGGHAGTPSPFALVQEIREWFSGPLALSGAIATGRAVLAARAMGADV